MNPENDVPSWGIDDDETGHKAATFMSPSMLLPEYNVLRLSVSVSALKIVINNFF